MSVLDVDVDVDGVGNGEHGVDGDDDGDSGDDEHSADGSDDDGGSRLAAAQWSERAGKFSAAGKHYFTLEYCRNAHASSIRTLGYRNVDKH